jgi:hypothetical protein
MRTRPERDLQQTAQYVCSFPRKCGKSYVSETCRPLAMQFREHRHNSKEGLVEKFQIRPPCLQGDS